jgi:hypothetical protein
MPATHYIHIGRNKCASSTLQYFFVHNGDVLQREALDYFVFGDATESSIWRRTLRTKEDYARHVAANPNRSTLISSEELMGPRARTHAAPMIQALAGAPRRVIAYIRDYNSWVRSAYMEAVMTGRTTLDFDTYLRQMEFSVSAMISLNLWAQHAGWENMHVRSLDPACLYHGDVLSDCARALGLDEALVAQHRPEPRHVSPHWLCVEIIRYLRASRAQSDWRTFTHEVIFPLRPLIEQAIKTVGADTLPVQYMTPEQSERIAALYNIDAVALSQHMGVAIPEGAAPFAEQRPFLPSIEQVPRELLLEVLNVADAQFKDEEPPAQLALRTALRWVRLQAPKPAKPTKPRSPYKNIRMMPS